MANLISLRGERRMNIDWDFFFQDGGGTGYFSSVQCSWIQCWIQEVFQEFVISK